MTSSLENYIQFTLGLFRFKISYLDYLWLLLTRMTLETIQQLLFSQIMETTLGIMGS